MIKKQNGKQLEYTNLVWIGMLALAIIWQGSYFFIETTCLAVALCIGGLFFYGKAAGQQIDWKTAALGISMLFFYFISTVLSNGNKQAAIEETLKILIFVMMLFLPYFIEKVETCLWGIYVGCILVAMIGILSYFKIFTFTDAVFIAEGVARLQSTLQYANTTAVLMGVGYLAGFYIISKKIQSAKVTIHLTMGNLLLIAFLLTFSRMSVMIFLVVVAGLIILVEKKWKLLLAIQVPVCFLIGFVGYKLSAMNHLVALLWVCGAAYGGAVGLNQLNRLPAKAERIFIWAIYGIFALVPIGFLGFFFIRQGMMGVSVLGSTFVSRQIYMQDGWKALLQSPWLGLGPGGWETKQFSLQSAQYSVKYAHNGLLQFALDGGIFVLAAFVGMVGLTLYRLVKRIRVKKEMDALVLLAILLFILIHSYFDFDLSYTALLMIVGIGVAYSQGTPIKGLVVKRVGITIVLAVSSYLFVGMSMHMMGNSALMAKQYKQAYEAFQILKAYKPYDPLVYKSLAACEQYTTRKMSNIRENVKKAMALSPYDPNLKMDLFKIARAQKEDVEERRILKRWIAMAPRQQVPYQMYLQTIEEQRKTGRMDRDTYNQEKQWLEQEVQKINLSMNPLSRYLKKGQKIQLEGTK